MTCLDHVWVYYTHLYPSIIVYRPYLFRPVYTHPIYTSFWAVPQFKIATACSGGRGSTTRVGNSWIARERCAADHGGSDDLTVRVNSIWLHIGIIIIHIYRNPMTLYSQYDRNIPRNHSQTFWNFHPVSLIFTSARDYALPSLLISAMSIKDAKYTFSFSSGWSVSYVFNVVNPKINHRMNQPLGDDLTSQKGVCIPNQKPQLGVAYGIGYDESGRRAFRDEGWKNTHLSSCFLLSFWTILKNCLWQSNMAGKLVLFPWEIHL